MFDSLAGDVLCIPQQSEKGRKRRVDMLQWGTILRQRWTKGSGEPTPGAKSTE